VSAIFTNHIPTSLDELATLLFPERPAPPVFPNDVPVRIVRVSPIVRRS
jgi:hypothetical protein